MAETLVPEETIKIRIASAAFNDTRPETVRGYVDRFDTTDGVIGWAVDLADPSAPQRLQLMVDETVVAECVTDLPRDDVATLVGRRCRPGFQFPPEVISGLRTLLPEREDAVLSVRFSEPALQLRSKIHPPALGLLLGHLSSGGAEGPDAEPEAVQESRPRESGFDLLARLSELRGQAQAMTERVFHADRPSGRVEAVAIDENGYVWMLGWMRRGSLVDYPAIIVDRQKIPTGFAFTYFERDDVGPGVSGFIGVALTDWRPNPGSEMSLHLDSRTPFSLQGARPLRIMSQAEFAEHFAIVRPRCHTGHTETLQQALMDPVSWTPNQRNVQFPIQCAVDQVLILPGFGCFASGWALSPLKAIQALSLRIGSTVLTCDPNSLYTKPRPDLDNVYPGCGLLLSRAGFVGAFTGKIPPGDLGGAVLKVIFQDETSVNFPLEPQVLRRLGSAVDFEAVLSLYPAIEAEPFFPAFAAAVRDEVRGQTAARMQPYMREPTPAALVVAAPADRSDLFLLIDNLHRNAHRFDSEFGLAMIASNGQLRAETVALFSALRRSTRRACSLFFVEDATYSFYQLPRLLETLNAERFCFVGSGLVLGREGWDAAATALGGAEPPPLTYLEVDDGGIERDAPSVSGECFLWSTQALAAAIAETPFMLGGFDGSIPGDDEALVVPSAASRMTRRNSRSLIAAEINRL